MEKINKKKLLSIAIPTYNRAEKLSVTLKNFVTQIEQFELYDDVEIVISNNASTDNTEDIVKQIIKKHPKVSFRYSKNDKNLGWENLKIVAQKAESKYVWFCSDDDLYDSDCLKKIITNIIPNKDVDYFYIPSSQSKIQFLKERGSLDDFISLYGMASACISSNVFSKNMLNAYKPCSSTWFHIDLLFNSNRNMTCLILDKMYSIDMPNEDVKDYWYNNARKVLDYDTEAVAIACNSSLSNKAKLKVYEHYKGCLKGEIKKYYKTSEIDYNFVLNCISRLKPTIFYYEKLYLFFKAIKFLIKKMKK